MYAPQIKSVRPLQQSDKPSKFIGDDGKRIDGRSLDEFRSVFMRTGMVKQAKGSAYIELNNTKVICSAYGPRQTNNEFSDKGMLNCDFKIASFASKQRRKKTRDEDKEFSIYMRDALEISVNLDKFPKSVVDVYALVLEDDGSALAAAIMCGSLALADAGIELYDLVGACSAIKVDSHIVIDPSSTEQKYGVGAITCAHMSNLNEITQLTEAGDVEYSTMVEFVNMCVDGCRKMSDKMRQTLATEHLK
ncbi:exosome complex protein MTR3 [Acrasis kona]|uniref:Exosome complex protein MTR3 n=1 Tax=Acrasis kona TaxID=1008807 RepID=A0AAW2YSD1_9EUKA